MATIYDVAAYAGVSPKTVSRVINGDAPVSDKTRAKVETAIGRALDLFNHTFKYDESLQIIESALEQVEPGAGNRVRQNYQSEKNNSLFF